MHFSSIFQIRAVWRVFAAAFPALAPSPTSPNAAFSAQVQIPPFGAPRRNRRGAARAPHCASRNAAKAAAFAAASRCSRLRREQRRVPRPHGGSRKCENTIAAAARQEQQKRGAAQSWEGLIKSGVQIAQINFSSDCMKMTQEYLMYFKEFSCNQAENMQARCMPRFIQRFP